MSTLADQIWVQGRHDERLVLFSAGASLPTWTDQSFAVVGADRNGVSDASFVLPAHEHLTGFPALVIFQGADKSHCVGRHTISGRPPYRLRFLLSEAGKISIEPARGTQILHRRGDPEACSVILCAAANALERGPTPKPSATTKAAIFVSYAASDAPYALNLVEAIERSGERCWIAPRDVRAGRDFREEIVAAIQQCSSIAVLISERVNASEHVLRELGLAEKFGKPVTPIRLDECELAPAFEYQLHAKHWIRYEPSFKFIDALIGE